MITEDKWTTLSQKWKYVTARSRVWQWKLDNNLPGRMGHIGDWLHRAEESTQAEISVADRHEDTANNIRQRLEEHRLLFQELDAIQEEFEQYRQAGECDDVVLPKAQMADMHRRFGRLREQSDAAVRKLEFEELKYRLLAFLVVTESNLKAWTVKYGYQQEVEEMLENYTVCGMEI